MRVLQVVLYFFLVSFGLSAQHIWERTNPGGGGAIATVGATSSGIILVASDLSGIYRSYDNGQYWDVLGANNGLLETHISSFGFDPTDGNTFFAGSYIGAYKTIDGGESFDFVFPGDNNSFEYSYIEDIAISASNHNIGYITHHLEANSSGEVYKTTDGGETWNAILGNNLPTDLHLIKLMIHPLDANIVYVLTGKSRWGCSEANLYRSIDGGVNWTEIGDEQGDILDFDLHPTGIDIVFISTFVSLFEDIDSCNEMETDDYYSDDETAGAFYKSADGGSTFTEICDKTGIISVGIDDPNTIRLLEILFPYDWNDDAGTWETTDGGNSWTHTGFVDTWQKGFTENQYFTMSRSFNGLNKTVTKDIFNSDNYYASFGQWAWGSFDGGKHLDNISTKEVSENHWISTGVENVNGHCIDVNDSKADVVYLGMYDMGFWYTRDHGESWSRTQPDYNIYPYYSWNLGDIPVPTNMAKRGAGANVMTLISDSERENVVWASFSKEQLTDPVENTIAYTGLFRSTNYGEDWQLISQGLPPFNESIRMYGLSIDKNSPTNNRTLYITVDGDIYKSIDDGFSWELSLANGGLKFTEVDNFNGNIVYAGGVNGFWRSDDAGTNWEEVGPEIMRKYHDNTRPDIVPTWRDYTSSVLYPWEGVFDIEADPNIPNRVYAVVHSPIGGIYRSDDAGTSWSDNLLPDTDMRGISVAPFNSDVIYATSSMSYHSGGYGNSLGVMYSVDAGTTWTDANDGMAFDYAGMIEIEHSDNPYVWLWSPGTGVQRALIPSLVVDTKEIDITNELFPNPTGRKVKIPIEYNGGEVHIFSVAGKHIMTLKLDSESIDLSSLDTGFYLLKIYSENKDKTQVFKINMI